MVRFIIPWGGLMLIYDRGELTAEHTLVLANKEKVVLTRDI
jgi:hypothetical protein